MNGDLSNLLAAASKRRKVLSNNAAQTAYRLVNGASDGLPDVTVDWFDGVAVVSLYRAFSLEEERGLLSTLAQVTEPRAVYLKRRPKEARVLATLQKATLAPDEPVYGDPVESCVVQENGLRYLIRPSQGLSVGLYLDMRETRAWVSRQAKGATFLNCFSYTCAFAVSAKSGGATRVLNLDLSKRVLLWGQENAALNDQAVAQEDYWAEDVFEALPRLARRGESFTWVILDPPSFATSKQTRFSAFSDYGRLVMLASALVQSGGVLLACCNLSSFSAAAFEATVKEAAVTAGRQVKVWACLGASSVDFPELSEKPGALKVLALRFS